MDPFNFPAVGDARAVGSKYGSSSGTSTDIIYPVSKQIDSGFLPGRTLELAWSSDQHRFFSPKNTRLYVEYELMYGEVEETCANVETGPADMTGASAGAPPSKSLRMTAMPNSTLFDSQVRFVANNTVVEQTNYYSDMCQAQLLTTSNIEGTNTSASNMLTSLRKDAGVPTGIFRGQQRRSNQSDGYELCPVVQAPYVKPDDDGNYVEQSSLKTFGETLADISASSVAPVTGLVAADAAVRASGDTNPYGQITLTIPAGDEATARGIAQKLERAENGTLTRTAGTGGFGATSSTSTEIIRVDIDLNAGKYAGAKATVTTGDFIKTAVSTAVFSVTLEQDKPSDKPEVALMKDIASTLAVKVKSDVGKHTTPNPKAQVLQQGYHPSTKTSKVQISEPVMLSSWMHPWAMPPGAYQLFLTISPNYLKDLLFDPSGQYGCPNRAGEAVMFGATKPATIARNTVYVRIKDVSLHVHYIHPVEPYIPKSISIKTNPFTIAKRQLRTDSVQETFVVPPGTRHLMLFLVQDIHHLCADFELDGRAKAGAGVNALGETDNTDGKFKFDSQAHAAIRDVDIDPRVSNTVTDYQPTQAIEAQSYDGTFRNLELSAPHYWTSLQVQLGQEIQPREQLTQQNPTSGEVSRAWTLYTDFIAKSSGFRGSVMSYADFCGYHNANYNSGPRCGSRGTFHMFNIQNKSGSLSSDLQIRGTLSGRPSDNAKQFLVVMAVSESMFDISYQAPSPVPVMTRIQPLA